MQLRLKIRRYFLAVLLLAQCLLIGCGLDGGGTAGTPQGPARAKVRVEPRVIDSGDLTFVEVYIDQVTIDNLAVKIAFPTALSYVIESSMYEVDGVSYDTGPDAKGVQGQTNYLVYYVSPEKLSPLNGGFYLLFELRGVGDVENGRVEVDIDADDPLIDNSVEFDPANPMFDAQASASIRVGVVRSTEPESK